jgi:hypothetical protein
VVPLHGRRHTRGGKLSARATRTRPGRRRKRTRSFSDGQCMATNMDGTMLLS